MNSVCFSVLTAISNAFISLWVLFWSLIGFLSSTVVLMPLFLHLIFEISH